MSIGENSVPRRRLHATSIKVSMIILVESEADGNRIVGVLSKDNLNRELQSAGMEPMAFDVSALDRGRQIMSPTPLFSHCPANIATSKIHKFDVVEMPHGKTRMAGRQHLWDQNTQTDGTLKKRGNTDSDPEIHTGTEFNFYKTSTTNTKLSNINLSDKDNRFSIGAYIASWLFTNFVWTDFINYNQVDSPYNPSKYSNGIRNMETQLMKKTGNNKDADFFKEANPGDNQQNDFFATKIPNTLNEHVCIHKHVYMYTHMYCTRE